TPFTRIRSLATSRASVFKAPTTPRRSEFERTRLSIGWRTDIERIATTAPPPRARIEGRHARMSRTVLWNVSSHPFAHWSSAKVSNPPGGGPPAFGTTTSTPPNEATAPSTKALTPSARDTSAGMAATSALVSLRIAFAASSSDPAHRALAARRHASKIIVRATPRRRKSGWVATSSIHAKGPRAHTLIVPAGTPFRYATYGVMPTWQDRSCHRPQSWSTTSRL